MGSQLGRANLWARVQEAVAVLRRRAGMTPSVGIILGSGLGALADHVEEPRVIPYSRIPHFPQATVPGHAARLLFGRLEGRATAVMLGRPHYFEGHSLQQVTFPVRVLRGLGVETLILTNVAGGLNPAFRVGDLMLIADILNLMGDNPLRGRNDDRLGPRFPAMRDLFSPELVRLARQAARRHRIPLRQGVYAAVSGPNYETAAEIRMLRTLGADAVGMSTVPEILVARHAGFPRILGISCITNVESGSPAGRRRPPPSHEAVLAAARKTEPRLTTLLRDVVARL